MIKLFTKGSAKPKTLFLTCLLILSVFLTSFPLNVKAASKDSDNDFSDIESLTGSLQAASETVLELPEKQLSSQTFNFLFSKLKKEIPSVIDTTEALLKGHIKRLTEFETDENTIVFENADGSRTEYYFSFPVKFSNNTDNINQADQTGQAGKKDQNRTLKDVSLKIKKDFSSFTTEANSIITTFSKYLSKGISLKNDELNISMFPKISKERKGSLSADGLNVTYTLDESTKLDYSLTYLGFKENIIVSEYTGVTEYNFTLETNGLKPEKLDGSWFLTDNGGEIRATIGDIIVFTADEKNNTLGGLDFTEIIPNQKYEAVITLDPEYLKDPNTAYPICIDPTIEVNASSGAGKLEDVTINSKTASVGAKDALYIGRSNTAGIQRVLMRFPGLNLSRISSGSQITSAYVVLRDLMCQYWTMNVNCHVFTGNGWAENYSSWSNVNPNSYGVKLSTLNVNYPDGTKLSPAHNYKFDITEAVKGWKDGRYNINLGLMFKADDSFEQASGEAYKTFGSYNRASYKPSLCITYKPSISLDKTSISLVEGNTTTLKTTTNVTTASVTWSSTNNEIATVSSTGVVTAKKAGYTLITATVRDTDGSVRSTGCEVYVIVQNGVYIIQNKNSGKYLTVKDGGIESYTDVIQDTLYSGAETKRITQMWKICYIGNGFYSVRPMNKLDMGLDVARGNVGLYKIGTTDALANVIDDDKWSIDWRSDGYVFVNNDDPARTMLVSGASSNAGATVVVGSFGNNYNSKWNLVKQSSAPSGAYLYDKLNKTVASNVTKELKPGLSLSLQELGLCPICYSASNIDQIFSWKSSNPAVVSVNENGMINTLSTGTATIIGQVYRNYKYYTVSCEIVVCKKAIVIVPGFGGSNLKYADGTDAFSTTVVKTLTSIFEKLEAKDGTEKAWGILKGTAEAIKLINVITGSATDSIVPENGGYGYDDMYKKLFDELNNSFSFEYDTVFFSYDWRKSNADSAEKLSELCAQYDKVVLVGHSMGGLVVSKMLADDDVVRKKVEKNVSIATPYLGAPVVPYLYNGGNIEVFEPELADYAFIFSLIQDEAIFCLTSALECLPSMQSESINEKQFIGYDRFDYMTDYFAEKAQKEYLSLKLTQTALSIIKGLLGQSPDSLTDFINAGDILTAGRIYNMVDSKINAAKDFQNSLWIDGKHVTTFVDSYYIYGESQSTIVGFDSSKKEKETIAGDSFVPIWSASINNLYGKTASFKDTHEGLVSNKNVLEYIKNLIQTQ